MNARRVAPGEVFEGRRCTLRLATLDDCTDRYVAWLNDPLVNRYLETRWTPQTIATVREFVAAMTQSPDSYLFAIRHLGSGDHVGNIKIGPLQARHAYAEISYFIGERSAWGQGLATDAIRVVSTIGFDRLGLHRIQAGVYATNVASARALEKAGYRHEGTLRAALAGPDGWEDLLRYGRLRDDPPA